MSFLAVLLALIVEQLRPLPQGNPVHEALIDWSRWTARNFDAGREHHAWVVWAVTVFTPALLVWGVFELLHRQSLLLALGWNLLILYLTLGFRQFSHYFTDIRDALEQGDEERARRVLQEWRHLDVSELPRTELLRHVIEHALLAAHRHVFGVFFWFVLGSALGLGPVGAAVYRMSEFCARYWAFKTPRGNGPRQWRPDAPRPDRVLDPRPRAGAVDGGRFCGGRQFRGGGGLLAPVRGAVEAVERRHPAVRGGWGLRCVARGG